MASPVTISTWLCRVEIVTEHGQELKTAGLAVVDGERWMDSGGWRAVDAPCSVASLAAVDGRVGLSVDHVAGLKRGKSR